MIYKDLIPITRECATYALDSEVEDRITDALLRLALHESDWKWVQEKCIDFTNHESITVRRIAIQCFGHLARIHRKLDMSIVQPILIPLRNDPAFSDVVENTFDDIEIFVGSDMNKKASNS